MTVVPDILIICVGAVKDPHLAALAAMYHKRIRNEAKVEIREIGDGNRASEGEKIASALERLDGRTIALSEEGRTLGSQAFASLLENNGRRVIFTIGGADGLSDRVKKRASELVSLSALTFTHEMARVILLEQIYRACSIIHNRSYHRG